MVTRLVVASAALLAMFVAGTPLWAHHNANAEFDTQKQLTITGVLTKVENINPHSWFYVDVKAADGTMQSWKLESLSPSGLIRQGLKVKSELRMGSTYSFRISPAWKDPAPPNKVGFMRAIIVDGKEYVLAEL